MALTKRLATGPAFLFLGQSSDRLASGVDDLLGRAAKQAFNMNSFSYQNILELEPGERARVYDALRAVEADQIDSSPWLEEVARFPWNVVFTTRLDESFTRAF